MDNLGTLGDIPKDLCPAYKVRSFNFYLRFDKFLFIEFEFIHLVFFFLLQAAFCYRQFWTVCCMFMRAEGGLQVLCRVPFLDLPLLLCLYLCIYVYNVPLFRNVLEQILKNDQTLRIC